MDPALFRLLMMRLRGGFRLRLIQLTSLRGLLFFLAFVGIIWLLEPEQADSAKARVARNSVVSIFPIFNNLLIYNATLVKKF